MKRVLSILLLAATAVSACYPAAYPAESPAGGATTTANSANIAPPVDQLHAINLALIVEARYTRIPPGKENWSPITIEEAALTNLADTEWGMGKDNAASRTVWVVKISGRWSDPHPPQKGQAVELHFLVVVVDAEKGELIGYGMFVVPPTGG